MLLFSSAYNEYTDISKEYTGPLDFDITGVDCILLYTKSFPNFVPVIRLPIKRLPLYYLKL